MPYDAAELSKASNAFNSARVLEEASRRKALEQLQTRRWKGGDVYSPHDLSGPEMRKWSVAQKRARRDVFDVLGINPIKEYKVRDSPVHETSHHICRPASMERLMHRASC